MNSYEPEGNSIDELSRETLGSYQSKASDARGHRKLSTKKVDKRYSGVALASKKLDKKNKEVDEGNFTVAAPNINFKVHKKKPQGKSFLQGFTDRKNKGIKSKPIDKDKFFGKKKVKEGGFDTHTDVVANTKAASKKPKRGAAKCCDETPLPSVVHEAVDSVVSKSVDDSGIKTTKFKSGKYAKSGAGGTTTYGKSGQQLSHSTPRIGGVKVTKIPDSKMGPGNRGISTTTNFRGKLRGSNVNLTSKDGVAQRVDVSNKGIRSYVDSANKKVGVSMMTKAGRRGVDLGADKSNMSKVGPALKNMFRIKKGTSLDKELTGISNQVQKSFTKESIMEEADDSHHATVTYHKGTYSMPGKNDGDYHKVEKKIPLKKVDTAKGFSRTSQSTGIEVKKHEIHKQMKKDGYSIHSISHPNRAKHYRSASGRTNTRYEGVNLKFSEWLTEYEKQTRYEANEHRPAPLPPKWNAPNSGREGMSRQKIMKSMIQQEKDRDKRKHERMMNRAKAVDDTRKKTT